MNKRKIIIPIFVSHKGCPHNCIFCDQKKISGHTGDVDEKVVQQSVQSHLATLKNTENREQVQIAFYGGSFTGIGVPQQKALLDAAGSFIKQGLVDSIRISTRPDTITPEILNMLKAYKVETIELGVQSLDEEVLKLSCRGHDAEQVYEAAAMIKASGFELGLQMMVGLPGDNREKDLRTAAGFIAMKPHMVRIYPVLVIRNTYLEKMFLEGRYVPVSLEDAVQICAELLTIFRREHIDVIRVGLQTTGNINSGGDIVAGPFHPAFRELVEASIMLEEIEKNLPEESKIGNKSIIIAVNPKQVSMAAGQKRCNIRYLQKKYGLNRIKVVPDERIAYGCKVTIYVE